MCHHYADRFKEVALNKRTCTAQEKAFFLIVQKFELLLYMLMYCIVLFCFVFIVNFFHFIFP